MPTSPNSVGATCWKLYSRKRSSACSTAEKNVCSSTNGSSRRTGRIVIGGAPFKKWARNQPRQRKQTTASPPPSPRASHSECDATADADAPRRRMK